MSVAHAYNPSYSGGRDQEDSSSKPAQTNCWRDPILKKILHKKRAGGVVQSVGPEFKPQYEKKLNLVFNIKYQSIKILLLIKLN
jgi:hypothetical protein